MISGEQVATNLPASITSFIGREAELVAVGELLQKERLVTLSGPGGCGKTRLAIELAASQMERRPGGVYLVELAPVADTGWVADVIRTTLEVPERPDEDRIGVVARSLPDASLIVLDNCEHLLDESAAVVADLLAACPTLQVLATSRQSLGIDGEVTWRVPSLGTPPVHEATGIDAILHYEAVQLFVDRARRVRQDFAVTPENAELVAELVRRLDGIPLAIELAAARVASLGLERIVVGLQDRFALLTRGSRDGDPRHQTLAASVDWSYQLLTPDEQLAWGRLSTFAGGFTLDAAREVSVGIGAIGTADLVAQLVDRSLIQVDEQLDGELRYSMLETIGQYGVERLREHDELDEARDLHLAWVQHLAASAEPELTGLHQALWLDRLDAEHENVRRALSWAIEQRRADAILAISAALNPFWKLHGHLVEGRSYLQIGLELAEGNPQPGTQRTLWALGDLCYWAGDFEEAEAHCQLALDEAERQGDLRTMARATWSLANIGFFTTSPPESRPQALEAVDLARAAGDEWCLGVALQYVALTHLEIGYDDEAQPYADEARSVAAASGSPQLAAWNWVIAQALALHRADFDEADRCYRIGLEAIDALDDPSTRAHLVVSRAQWLHQRGRTEEAISLLGSCVIQTAGGGAHHVTPLLHLQLGMMLLGRDDHRAQGLLVEVQRETEGVPFWSLMAQIAAAALASSRGDPAAARNASVEALALARRFDHQWTVVTQLRSVALAELADDPAQAESRLLEALQLCVDRGFPVPMTEVLGALASVASARRLDVEAARLLGAALGRREQLGVRPLRPSLVRHVEAAAVERIGAERHAQALEEGRSMGLDAAVALANRNHGLRRRPVAGWASLTPAEARVVELAAQGLTNPQIAARLFVSAGTVKTHLGHAFAKLAVTNRTELAAAAARRTGDH